MNEPLQLDEVKSSEENGIRSSSLSQQPEDDPVLSKTQQTQPIKWYHRVIFYWTWTWLSFFFAETCSGSSVFPYNNLFSVFYTIPMYGIHSIFLGWIVIRGSANGRFLSLSTLFIAGALLGLYEAYITKVLWNPTWAQAWTYRVEGVSVPQTVILILYWHNIWSFTIPFMLLEGTMTNSKVQPLFNALPKFCRFVANKKKIPFVVFLGFLMFYISVNCSGIGSWQQVLGSSITVAIILASIALFRRLTRHMETNIVDFVPGKIGFIVTCVFLAGLYALAIPELSPANLPAVIPGQLSIWVLYMFFALLLALELLYCRLHDPFKYEGPHQRIIPFSWPLAIGLGITFEVVAVCFTFTTPTNFYITALPGMGVGVIIGIILLVNAFVESAKGIRALVQRCSHHSSLK